MERTEQTEAVETVEDFDLDTLKNILEGALLAAAQPLGLDHLQSLFGTETAPDKATLRRALGRLEEDCAGRAVELVEVASGYRLQVRQELQPWVSKLFEERPQRYSRALLETLALIAYRQPITRGEIEDVRGVSVSTNIVRTLEEREWIRVVGHRDVPGKPALYGTTRGFLDYFGLKSLDDLPSLAEIRDIDDLEPELDFDGEDGEAADAPATASVPVTDAESASTGGAEEAEAGSAGDDRAGVEHGQAEETGVETSSAESAGAEGSDEVGSDSGDAGEDGAGEPGDPDRAAAGRH